MDRSEREALDRHITGNYGEDQLRDDGPEDDGQDDSGPAEVAYPDVSVQLSGDDGDAFFIIGQVHMALRRAGHNSEASAFVSEAKNQPSYDAVLQLAMRTVETS